MRISIVLLFMFFFQTTGVNSLDVKVEKKKPAQLEKLKEKQLEAFLLKWRESQKKKGAFEIKFQQEKKLRFFKKPLVSKGRIRWLDNRLLCEVYDKKGKLDNALLVNKGELQIYYPRLKRLEIFPAGTERQSNSSLPIFQAEPKVLRKSYEVTLFKELPIQEKGSDSSIDKKIERQHLVLKAKEASAPIKKVTLIFEKTEIKEVHQIDRKGGQVKMKLETLKKADHLKPEHFKLDAPAGTKIVTIKKSAGKGKKAK